MNGERWRRVRELFAEVETLTPPAREARLAAACASDPDLRAEVDRLLAAAGAAGSFLESPPTPPSALAASGPTLAPGTRLGRYEVQAPLGAGGMGEVFRARDTELERTVAIKVLPAELAADASRRRRFEREARAVAALSHRHICAVHDVGHEGGRDFLVMELVDGENLATVLARGPLPLDRVIRYGIEIAEALEEAHRHGIVHRDLKPANVMVTRGGVKLLDFGLAKLFEPENSGEAATLAPGGSALTARGMVMGTLPYMAPEQLAGDVTDVRTDIFALGLLLFEMTTGRRAFAGASRQEILSEILHEDPPPLASLRTGTPPGLERIVRTCLAKEREARWQTAREVALALSWISDPALSGSGTTAAVTREQRRVSPLVIALGGVLLLALLAIGVLLYRRATAKVQPAAEAHATTMSMQALTSGGRAASGEIIDGELSISPDGKYVAFATLDEHQASSLWVRQVSSGSEVKVVPSQAGRGFAATSFSPDGDQIYFTQTGDAGADLYRVPTIGGRTTRVLHDVTGAVTFSPDGSHIAFVRVAGERQESLLMVAARDGSGARIAARQKFPRYFHWEGVDWSPDGRMLAAVVGSWVGGNAPDTVIGFPVAGGAPVPLTPGHWANGVRVLWLRDGSGLVITAAASSAPLGTQLYFLPQPPAPPRRITNDLDGYGGVSLGVTADGRTIATIRTSSTARLWVLPAGGGEAAARMLGRAGERAGFFGVTWTPDGRIVYQAVNGGRADLWSIAADGSDARPITDDAATEAYPAVSPDGRYLVFQSDRDDRWRFWRTDLDGSNPLLLANEASQEARPAISPDSRWVYYGSLLAGHGGVWRVALQGGPAVQLSTQPALSVGPSPDGKELAYGYEQTRQPKLVVMAIAGGAPRAVIDLPQNTDPRRGGLRWSPDGSTICFPRYGGQTVNVWCQPVAGGPPRQLTHLEKEFLYNYAISPDGKQVAIARGIETSDLVLIRGFR